MAISKVLLNNTVLIDMTDATADNTKILSSYTAYGATGKKEIGTFPSNYEFDNLNTMGTVWYSNGNILALNDDYAASVTVYRKTKQLKHNWDLTKSLTDTINGTNITLKNSATRTDEGLKLSSSTQYAQLGVTYSPYRTYEFDIADMDVGTLDTHGRLIMMSATEGLIYRTGSVWSAYLGGGWATNSSSTESDLLAGHTLRMAVTNGAPSFYIDGVLWYSPTRSQSLTSSGSLMIGSSQGQGYFNITITGIRVYEGVV